MSKLEGRWRKARQRLTSQEKEGSTGALDVWVTVSQNDPGLSFGVQQPPSRLTLPWPQSTHWRMGTSPILHPYLWWSLAVSEAMQVKSLGYCF